MLLKNLTKVYISEYEKIKDHGETKKIWKYKGIAYLNLQCDISELDRKPTGEIDYSIVNARTDKNYDIQKGNGISLVDISALEEFTPEYRILDKNNIGSTYMYRMEKIQK